MSANNSDQVRLHGQREQQSPMPVIESVPRFSHYGSPKNIDLVELGKLIFGMVVKYRPFIIAITLAAIAVSIVITILSAPMYRGTGVVQIQPEEGRIVSVDDIVENSSGSDSPAYYQTQYGLLRSRTLAARVVNQVGAQTLLEDAKTNGTPLTPEEAQGVAIKLLTDRINIRPTVGSRLVNIEYESKSPALAARVVDGYIDEFIAVSLERRFEASSYARTFLETRLNDLRQKIEDTERQLVQYAESADLIASTPETGPETTVALNALVSAKSAAVQRRIEASERAAAVRRQASEIPELVNSPALQALRADLIRAQAVLAEQRQVFGPDYPGVRQLEGRVSSFRAQLQAETERLKSSILNAAVSNLEEATQVEAQLDAEIASVRASARDVDRRSIDYNILRRELDTNKTLYDGLLQRYREIGVAGGIGINNISVVDRAVVPAEPFSPRPVLNIALGLLAGLGLSAVFLFVVENWSQALRRPDELTRAFNLPLLGVVPKFTDDIPILARLADQRSSATEAYHAVRAGILFSGAERMPKSILFTSSRPGEGKTTSAISTAMIFARTGLKVILVDGDLRDPSLHGLFGIRSGRGLSSVFAGTATVEEVLTDTSEPNLKLITAGPLPENAAELISRPGTLTGLSMLEDACDLLVIDSPPVLGLADAPMLSTMVEATVFVMRANLASKLLIRRSLARLQSTRTNLIGAVLTGFDARNESYGGYDYNSTYGDGGYGYGGSGSDAAVEKVKAS